MELHSVNRPYERGFYPPRPTRWTLFFRTFIPYQLWRFVMINLKMIFILRRCHLCMGRLRATKRLPPRESTQD